MIMTTSDDYQMTAWQLPEYYMMTVCLMTADIVDNQTLILDRQSKQMEQILNFQVPAEGLELVILLLTQY